MPRPSSHAAPTGSQFPRLGFASDSALSPDQRVCRGEGCIALGQRFLVSPQVEVEARIGVASIFFQALALTDTNARPGGSISAFCEPVTQTSMFQSSTRHSIAPSPLIPSTTRSASVLATSLPNAAMSWPTPVLVSLSVANTAFASGFLPRASARRSGVTALPKGTSTTTMFAWNALRIPRQRSPSTGRAENCFLARSQCVGNRGLHPTRSRTGDGVNGLGRLEDVFEVFRHFSQNRFCLGGPVIGHWLGEFEECFLGNAGLGQG